MPLHRRATIRADLGYRNTIEEAMIVLAMGFERFDGLRLSLGADADLNGSLDASETLTSAELDCAGQNDVNNDSTIGEAEAGRFSTQVAAGGYSHVAVEILDASSVALSWAVPGGQIPSTRQTFAKNVVVAASQAAEIEFDGIFTINELAIQVQ